MYNVIKHNPIGTRGTASASELVINSFIPYLNARAGLIGTNTYGKPVGQGSTGSLPHHAG